jgi:NADH-quinone oxidoreductase subunit E
VLFREARPVASGPGPSPNGSHHFASRQMRRGGAWNRPRRPDRSTMPFSLSEEHEKIVEQLIARYPTKAAACIPVLHLCQKQLGWVSPEIVDYVARRLDMASSEVKGVVTFYTMYHQAPPGKHTIWVCRTLSCDLRGAKTIQEHLERKLGCHAGETTADGTFTLKKAECLAACGYAPMVQIDDAFYEDLTVEKIDALIDRIARGETPPQEESPWVVNAPSASAPSA